MSQYNVAIITGQLVVGGAERQLYLWLAHLDRSRFRPVVLTLHPNCGDYWERAIESLGVPVLGVERRRNPLLRLLAIKRTLRPFGPQLIHGWNLFASPYAGAAARVSGADVSLGSVRGSFQTYERTGLTAALTNVLTDGLVVNSAVVARQIENGRRLCSQRVFAVPNAVEEMDCEREAVRSRFADLWKIPESRIWLGSIGRFEKSKRFDLLLELTASYANERETLHLVLIGYGQETGPLKAAARALGIEDRVTFTGLDSEARRWIMAFDIFGFTSVDEGLPNVVMEAAAAGVPVLAWRTDFLCELLGRDGCAELVEPGNFRALREGLSRLASNRDYRLGMGEAARREILRHFGVPMLVRRMSAVYEGLLEAKRSLRT